MRNLTELNFSINKTNQKVIICEVYNIEQAIHNLKYAYANSRVYFKKEKKSIQFFTLLRDETMGYIKLTEKDVKNFRPKRVEIYQQLMCDTEDAETEMRTYYVNDFFIGALELNEVEEKYRPTVLLYLLTEINESNLKDGTIDLTKFAHKHNIVKKIYERIYNIFKYIFKR